MTALAEYGIGFVPGDVPRSFETGDRSGNGSLGRPENQGGQDSRPHARAHEPLSAIIP
jgi:hypothetical protein